MLLRISRRWCLITRLPRVRVARLATGLLSRIRGIVGLPGHWHSVLRRIRWISQVLLSISLVRRRIRRIPVVRATSVRTGVTRIRWIAQIAAGIHLMISPGRLDWSWGCISIRVRVRITSAVAAFIATLAAVDWLPIYGRNARWLVPWNDRPLLRISLGHDLSIVIEGFQTRGAESQKERKKERTWWGVSRHQPIGETLWLRLRVRIPIKEIKPSTRGGIGRFLARLV